MPDRPQDEGRAEGVRDRENYRRGAMWARSHSGKGKFRRLTLQAKAALPHVQAWSDDQGRILIQADDLKLSALAAFPEILEEDVMQLFEEYDANDWGILYEYGPGQWAMQWKEWDILNPMRRRYPSRIPAPPGWVDDVHTAKDESWYQERRKAAIEARGGKELERRDRSVAATPKRPPTAMDPADELEMLRAPFSDQQRKWLEEAESALRAHGRIDPQPEAMLPLLRKWTRKYDPSRIAGACQTFVNEGYAKKHGVKYLEGILENWNADRTPGGKLTRIAELLTNEIAAAPASGDRRGRQMFADKLLDLMKAEARLPEATARSILKAVDIATWSSVEPGEVKERIRNAVLEHGAAVYT